MATPRRPLIDFYGLRITVEPTDLLSKLKMRPFYLLGGKPLFKLVVKNPSDKRRYGKIVLRWRLSNYMTHRLFSFNIGPGECKEYPIQREWLVATGEAVYELIVPPRPPEDCCTIEDHELLKLAAKIANVHPLCVYMIRDKVWAIVTLISLIAGLISAFLFLSTML